MSPTKTALLPVALVTMMILSCNGDRGPSANKEAMADSLSYSPAMDSVARTSAERNEDQNQVADGILKQSESNNRFDPTTNFRSDPGFLLPIVTAAGKLNKLDSTHRFLRTADLKFRVNDVTNATYRIEDIAMNFGGYIADTKLTSDLLSNSETPVSADSSLQTMRYVVSNTIVMRIPAQKLDSALKAIAPLVDYLDHRNVLTTDITLDIFENQLQQTRISKYNTRLAADVDNKGNKLPDIQGAEDAMLHQQENSDRALVENMRMDDRVRYSTVSVNIYQHENIRQQLVKRERPTTAYEPGFGEQIGESLYSGWRGARVFLSGVVMLWPLWMLGASLFFAIRFFVRKSAQVSK